ncbi:hypothetical protein NUU61_008102 [Penicillium alfredii]|uniref:CCHC-type domain-containing protein n=1 Tax=Penicillium alfredii TaxID=1506179 RepID=A0A9W9ES05_9EURO|nr:uncharacterized protein NUU61_008102 [Penicillium alfredii]KAJ5086795.1 hypothetical protein NUU61_008102 [Penicillium alfredii]
MADSSGEEADSRTASVGGQRSQPNGFHDSSSRPTKRQRRNKPQTDDTSDFVPRGASFSANALQIDPDSTSSSGSSSDSDTQEPVNPHAGSTAPAVNWNQGRKNAVRTTLRRQPAPPNDGTSTAQFNAVNDKFWRSRSASVSSGSNGVTNGRANIEEGLENKVDEGSDSEVLSLDSAADDSIMLNIGNKIGQESADSHLPESLPVHHPQANGNMTKPLPETGSAQLEPSSKEEAFQLFSRKYPIAPSTLVDLDQEDLELQGIFVFFDRNINDVDLSLPVTCLECRGKGHLDAVCSTKECEHCGAWSQHMSRNCPTWRRCQRCRDRGHHEWKCASPLKSSAQEVPCDHCGSSDHLELQCEYRWKLPLPDLSGKKIVVSISCANCTSPSHLIGDCPNLSRPYNTSFFTLKGIDPANIVNLNTLSNSDELPPPDRPPRGPGNRGPRGGGGRGRGGSRIPSPDDTLSNLAEGAPGVTARGGKGRGNIRFGGGGGSNPKQGGRGQFQSRPPHNNRGRPQYPGNNTRQRSLSPPRPPQGPPFRGGKGGRGRGGSRGGPRGKGRRGQ